jgi:hypothetical protein
MKWRWPGHTIPYVLQILLLSSIAPRAEPDCTRADAIKSVEALMVCLRPDCSVSDDIKTLEDVQYCLRELGRQPPEKVAVAPEKVIPQPSDTLSLKTGVRHYIQLKSLQSLDEARLYARSSSLQPSVFLAKNGWFAIAVEVAVDADRAKQLAIEWKADRKIPDDSFVTKGGNYVREVCCR